MFKQVEMSYVSEQVTNDKYQSLTFFNSNERIALTPNGTTITTLTTPERTPTMTPTCANYIWPRFHFCKNFFSHLNSLSRLFFFFFSLSFTPTRTNERSDRQLSVSLVRVVIYLQVKKTIKTGKKTTIKHTTISVIICG